MEQKNLAQYDVFIDQGPFAGCMIPQSCQLIQVHTIFDVKVTTAPLI